MSTEKGEETEHVDDVARYRRAVGYRLPGLGTLADFAVFSRHGDLERVRGVDIEVVGVDAVLVEGSYREVEECIHPA